MAVTFAFSQFSCLTDCVPDREDRSLKELGEMLTVFDERDEKDGPLWSPTHYPPGATRKAVNVEAISCIVLDFDSGVHWDELTPSWSLFTWILHTTHGHTEEHPKWRAVFPLSSPVSSPKWSETYAHLAPVLSHAKADPACRDASRIYFLPSHPVGAPHFAARHKGRLLDPVADFAEADEPDEPVKKVGDDYDDRVSWEEVMEPAGFKAVPGHLYQGSQMWSRPGKEAKAGEHGALTGPCKTGDRCRFLTSTGIPAEFVGKPLTKWATYAVLRHGGDFKEAVKDLAARGFGSATRKTRSREKTTAAVAEIEPDNPYKPVIVVNNRDHRNLCDDLLTLLQSQNSPPQYFLRTNRPARIELGEKGPVIRDMGKTAVRAELAKFGNFIRINADGEKRHSAPPDDAIETMLAYRIEELPFPILKGISSCPTLTGSKIAYEPGYIDETKFFGFFTESVKPNPASATECAQIILRELLCDFPFADDASRAHALALMLMPIIRPAISGQTPMTIVDAPAAGTGKTLLAKVCLAVGLGEAPPTTAITGDEAELSKKLFSSLREGVRVFFMDDLKIKLSSPILAQALTTGSISDRILGASQTATVDSNALFVATANNVRLDQAIARRSIWIRLDSKTEDPSTRTGFKHKDIVACALKKRDYWLGLLCKMVEAWLLAGRPQSDKTKGSFEEWTAITGGILEMASVPGFLENDTELKDLAADETDEWKAFAEVWTTHFGDQPVTAAELAELAKEHNLMENLLSRAKDEKSVPRILGNALGRVLGRTFGTVQISRATKYLGNRRFKLASENMPGGSGGSCSSERANFSENLFDDGEKEAKKTRLEEQEPPEPPTGSNGDFKSHQEPPGGELEDYDPYADE